MIFLGMFGEILNNSPTQFFFGFFKTGVKSPGKKKVELKVREKRVINGDFVKTGVKSPGFSYTTFDVFPDFLLQFQSGVKSPGFF